MTPNYTQGLLYMPILHHNITGRILEVSTKLHVRPFLFSPRTVCVTRVRFHQACALFAPGIARGSSHTRACSSPSFPPSFPPSSALKWEFLTWKWPFITPSRMLCRLSHPSIKPEYSHNTSSKIFVNVELCG